MTVYSRAFRWMRQGRGKANHIEQRGTERTQGLLVEGRVLCAAGGAETPMHYRNEMMDRADGCAIG